MLLGSNWSAYERDYFASNICTTVCLHPVFVDSSGSRCSASLKVAGHNLSTQANILASASCKSTHMKSLDIQTVLRLSLRMKSKINGLIATSFGSHDGVGLDKADRAKSIISAWSRDTLLPFLDLIRNGRKSDPGEEHFSIQPFSHNCRISTDRYLLHIIQQ